MENRRQDRALKGRMANLFELPQDVVLDVSRVTLLGDVQLAIENHRGLIEYTDEKVTVGIPKGQVVITGSELSIGTVTAEAVTILGRISGLRFEE